MANNDIIRSSMRSLTAPKHTNQFKSKLAKILDLPMSCDIRDKFSRAGLHISNGNISDAIAASMILQAMNGNIAAYTTIRDTMGYKPIEQVKNDVIVRVEMSAKARELGE